MSVSRSPAASTLLASTASGDSRLSAYLRRSTNTRHACSTQQLQMTHERRSRRSRFRIPSPELQRPGCSNGATEPTASHIEAGWTRGCGNGQPIRGAMAGREAWRPIPIAGPTPVPGVQLPLADADSRSMATWPGLEAARPSIRELSGAIRSKKRYFAVAPERGSPSLGCTLYLFIYGDCIMSRCTRRGPQRRHHP